MDALTISAASGLRARMESLEMLANNLANAATGGYKRDREFYSLYLAPEALDGPGPATLPVIERHWTDFSQGALRPTANPFDLAISGKGFFTVNGPAGRLYTRSGNFRLSAAGVLVSPEGYPVRSAGGGPLQAQSSAPIEVSPDGTVSQDGQVLGRLEIVEFSDPSILGKQGASYFRNTDPNAAPTAASGFEVQQGKLEGSNVAAAEGAVRLVSIMRQFEMLQKAIALGAEMNRRAVEEVARVGP
jgi:flagellar basal-body rod protein FlgF